MLIIIIYEVCVYDLKSSVSLSTVVQNRDRQGKLWLPQFSHF